MSETITKTIDETRADYRRWLINRGLSRSKVAKNMRLFEASCAKRKGKK